MRDHALPSQSFQAISNSGKQLRNGFSIVSETCSTTGLLVIKWHRVLEALPGAGSVLLGRREVSFLKDKDDNRLYPLRLKAYPEHTLTIVVFDSTTRHDENHYPYPPSPVSPSSLSPKSMPKSLRNTTFDTQTDQKGTKQDAAKHSNPAKQSSEEIEQLHNSHADEGHLSPPPPQYDNSIVMTDLLDLLISLPPEPLAVMNTYIQKYCSYIQSLQAGRTIRAASCAGEMEKLLGQLSFEKYRNESLQDYLNHMSRRLSKIQETMLETQQNAHVELETIQNRVQSVFQEATGNSAHRSPRLFVVLPVAGCSSDPHSRRFRVFFLCGCETFTRAAILGTKVVHLLHLSNHEGYDLKDPALFFDRFGSLVLGMMMLLKHGYSSSKVAVPPCKNGKLFRGYKAQPSWPLLVTQCAETLVDETIGFIQARTTQEIQSEAEWDQVLPYLHTHNEDCDIGNLAQSRISESFPDWNCVDHISGSSPDPNIMAIQALVEPSGGFLEKEQGAIQIILASRSAALDFYKSTIKKCSFWKWDVTLDWDATQEDLELFAASISNAAVVHLTVHGHRLQGRTSGAAKHSIRFTPLLELMSSGRVQSMCLVGFSDIFSSLGAARRSPMPSLLELSIDTELSCMDSSEKNGLAAILDSCPQLEELVLSCKTIEPVLEFFAGICKHLPRLQFLKLFSRGLCMEVHCVDRAIHEVAAEVTSWNEVPPGDRRLLQEGYLSVLIWREPPSEYVLSPDLRTILHRNSELTQVEMSVPAKLFSAVVNEFLFVLKSLSMTTEDRRTVSEHPRPKLQHLKLVTQGFADAGGQPNIDTRNGIRGDDDEVNTAMFVEFQKFYSKARITIDLEMSSSTSGVSMEAMADLFKRYGSSVRSLITNAHFNDRLINILDKNVHKQKHSNLKTLVLNPTGLSYCKTDDIERVLSYASELKDFSLQLEQLEDFEQQEKAARLLEDHGPRLTALSLSGRRASTWLLSSGSGGDILTEKLAQSETLTRQTMPNLKSLDIVCHGSQHISQENAECIASMVMGPAPLTEVRMEGIDAHLADWERIFKALCFSSLVELSVKASYVSRDVLLSLVRCIPVIRSGVPLRILNLANTPVARRDDDGRLDPAVSEYLMDLKKRAPYAKVSL